MQQKTVNHSPRERQLAQIKNLPKTLPQFGASAKIDLNSYSDLYSYLQFFDLPEPGNNLELFAGTLDYAQSDAPGSNTTEIRASQSGQPQSQRTHLMLWKPDNARGTAVVVHGYLDHTGLYGHLIRELLQQNLAVVCFDLIGHGLSSGEPASIGSFNQYVDQLNQVLEATAELCPGPLHGIGQSTGGAVLLKKLLDQDTNANFPFASLNLLAPLVQPKLWRIDRWLFKLTRPFRKSMKRVFRANSHNPEFLRFIRHSDPFQPHRLPADWIAAMADWVIEIDHCSENPFPINVIQGDSDGTLDWRHNIKLLRAKFPRMNLHTIHGAGHQLVNESEPLRREIFAALFLTGSL